MGIKKWHPHPRPVEHGIQNDACDHGSWIRESYLTPVFTGRGHGPWAWASFGHPCQHGPSTRAVCTELKAPCALREVLRP